MGGMQFDESGLALFCPWRTDNVDLCVSGRALRLKMDLSLKGKVSSSGKVTLVASTRGDREIGQSNVMLSCQVMLDFGAMADLSRIGAFSGDASAQFVSARPSGGLSSGTNAAAGEFRRYFLPEVAHPSADSCPFLSDAAAFKDSCVVLFFPDKDNQNLRIFLDELRSAKSSVDVCVFTLTMSEVVQTMKDLHLRGVQVRVISDNHCAAFFSGAVKEELVKCGISFRVDSTRFHMHHKFAVVDGRVLINGSFNWTRQAEVGNNENIVIYRDAPHLIRAFQAEFERLWHEFA